MGDRTSIIVHSHRHAVRRLSAWAKEHIKGTAISLLGTVVGLPLYMLLRGPSVDTLKEQVATIATYGITGPIALVVFAYLCLLVQAPFKILAERTVELKQYRRQAGRDISDLEPTGDGFWRRKIVVSTKLANALLSIVTVLTILLLAAAVGTAQEAFRLASEYPPLLTKYQALDRRLAAEEYLIQDSRNVHKKISSAMSSLSARAGEIAAENKKLSNALFEICKKEPPKSVLNRCQKVLMPLQEQGQR